MLYYINNLLINKIEPYHNTKEKIIRIRSTNEYKLLKSDIEKNGINDPILIINKQDVLEVHVGEQRLLIARELKMKNLRSFVYNKYNGKHSSRIKNISDITKQFKDITVPTCNCILKYIQHGQIKI